ncbi:hypothetical protein [Bradyrhizobium iriomotense]|uniref:HTH HARE-type domain-containing protein n=1 Tax=Bradyrhizobium iriomotense TaxID=441950 RepID=A0ABQ6BC73_9BRAD|nr:hypothetical protein [Bradyrhizobium iriomotense]GLR89768.1 hypothetical protein GCM10007857_64820 [Bradyrhizobium iriomotense]
MKAHSTDPLSKRSKRTAAKQALDQAYEDGYAAAIGDVKRFLEESAAADRRLFEAAAAADRRRSEEAAADWRRHFEEIAAEERRRFEEAPEHHRRGFGQPTLTNLILQLLAEHPDGRTARDIKDWFKATDSRFFVKTDFEASNAVAVALSRIKSKSGLIEHRHGKWFIRRENNQDTADNSGEIL